MQTDPCNRWGESCITNQRMAMIRCGIKERSRADTRYIAHCVFIENEKGRNLVARFVYPDWHAMIKQEKEGKNIKVANITPN